MAISPGAKQVAYTEEKDGNNALILLEPGKPDAPRSKDFAGKIGALAFSGDGRHLAMANGADDLTTVVRVDSDSLEETARFPVDKPIARLAVNGDGTRIAVASEESQGGQSAIKVWQVPLPSMFKLPGLEPTPTLAYQVQATESIEALALNPEGTQLAAASLPFVGAGQNLVLQAWNFSPDALIREACQRTGRDLSEDEKETYLQDRHYPTVCSASASGR